MNLGDHLLQQGLHLHAGFGVDRVDLALSVGVGGSVAPFEQVIVDLIDAAGAGLADFAVAGLEFRPLRRVFLLGGRFPACALAGRKRLPSPDPLLDLPRRPDLHGVRDVAVDVDGRGGRDVADDGGERLDVHSVLQRTGRERVPIGYNREQSEKPCICNGLTALRYSFSHDI